MEYMAELLKRVFTCFAFICFFVGSGMSVCAGSPRHLPVVVDAKLPIYPKALRAFGIQGVVKVRLRTDGSKVIKIESESGPPLLVKIVCENVLTWEFESHEPTTIDVVFKFKISEEVANEAGKTIIELPTKVELYAKKGNLIVNDPVTINTTIDKQ